MDGIWNEFKSSIYTNLLHWNGLEFSVSCQGPDVAVFDLCLVFRTWKLEARAPEAGLGQLGLAGYRMHRIRKDKRFGEWRSTLLSQYWHEQSKQQHQATAKSGGNCLTRMHVFFAILVVFISFGLLGTALLVIMGSIIMLLPRLPNLSSNTILAVSRLQTVSLPKSWYIIWWAFPSESVICCSLWRVFMTESSVGRRAELLTWVLKELDLGRAYAAHQSFQ